MKKALLLFFLFAYAQAKSQNKIITGTVRDEAGPLSGVTVTIDGSAGSGTQTDKNGSFKIQAPPNATLSFSSIGYATQKVAVTGKSQYAIVLGRDDKKLQEVVVTALGISREKKSLGYASQSIQRKI